ncbi:MAG: hypothetical protein M1819_001605 [Sarea resinae]|nr:MAG: hypothetical protein M1819_001605 [Sarea resinae]
MTRPPTPPILNELRNPSSSTAQVAALRALKNEIIGHEQKKEAWIRQGVVLPIVRILSVKPEKRSSSRETNGENGRGDGIRTSNTDEARLQATIIAGSLAIGGPAYVAPLLASSILPPLLSALSPDASSPQLVLATLRTLNIIADAIPLEYPGHVLPDSSLPHLLFSKKNVESLAKILSGLSPSSTVQNQIALSSALISKCCREERHQVILVKHGVLDALAARLAGFVISTGFSLAKQAYAPTENMPVAAPPKAKLAPILEAIAVIIQHSKLRASQLLLSPAITAIFPIPTLESPPKTPWGSFALSVPAARRTHLNPINRFLPQIPLPAEKRTSSQPTAFPPLGTAQFTRASTALGWTSDLSAGELRGTDEHAESPLIAWLIHMARAQKGITRVMAAWVVTVLFKSGLANKNREATLALLVVPLLVRLLDESCAAKETTMDPLETQWAVSERAPLVLAMLMMDSMELQKAAVNAHTIEKLSHLLKKTYDRISDARQSSIWEPNPENANTREDVWLPNTTTLGSSGLSPRASHILKCREGALNALAAVAPFKDEYRKMIIENGIVPFVIDSLKPYESDMPSRSTAAESEGSPQPVPKGNPVPVLLAACGAARAISRSVSILRTSLIDAGIATPLFSLLKHPSVEVQTAATAVVCNLVLEFSPMREAIMEAGILKILCDHAHSTNIKLRLNSVWALKHLVFSAPNDVKVSCVQELGPGWMLQLVEQESDDAAPPSRDEDSRPLTPLGLGTPNAAGERVDILNAVEEYRGSSISDDEDVEDDQRMTDSIGALSRPHPDYLAADPSSRDGLDGSRLGSSMPSRPTDVAKARLAVLKEAELESARESRSDDLAVQEQALDLIRNLICGPSAADMIDFLFSALGQERLFMILASKLRPKVFNAYTRRQQHQSQPQPQPQQAQQQQQQQYLSQAQAHGDRDRDRDTETRIVQPRPEIVIAVCYILVHIAAGHPRHRTLLIGQRPLLSLLVPLFNHVNRHIRSCCAWIVINLTWVDDASDELNCKQRAVELRSLGIEGRLRSLEHDPELDVRERTKTALHQLGALLR